MTLRHPWIALAGFIVLCLAVGILGGIAVASSIRDWYPTLVKPVFTPPSSVFAPVWTTLYMAMGVAAWFVWRTRNRISPAMILFFAQLALNLAWSFLFFGARSPALGLADIIALWIVLLLTIIAFFRRSTAAGLLMVPYLAWVSFAGALNFAIWRLN